MRSASGSLLSSTIAGGLAAADGSQAGPATWQPPWLIGRGPR